MKVLVISDTHKDISKVRKILKRIKSRIDYVIHLGDHINDALDLSYEFHDLHFECVAGNCDWFSNEDNEKCIYIDDKKFFITHGHHYGVKGSTQRIALHGKKLGVDGVLFGHSHVPVNDWVDDLFLMNPGSLTQPRGYEGPSYGIITIVNGKIEGQIIEYNKIFK
ncbi:metallophosphoesterase family protein [Vallitalea okinawensis]|uniref:metallophosphoesterase family protein n=1 Tax=Vallitalea okinawensis TaxID=2078660 RepID=UPI000CFC42D9|nr:metallophosphoesterase [Vallitalea okinawensis]